MKRIYFLLIPLFCFLLSCDKEASDYVKEANKAIENGDYQKAYNIYDEMKANNPHRGVPFHGDLEDEYDQACISLKESIVKSEIASTVEDSKGESTIAKIVYIVEDKGDNEKTYYEYAIKLAKAAGNDELAAGLSKVNE